MKSKEKELKISTESKVKSIVWVLVGIVTNAKSRPVLSK